MSKLNPSKTSELEDRLVAIHESVTYLTSLQNEANCRRRRLSLEERMSAARTELSRLSGESDRLEENIATSFTQVGRLHSEKIDIEIELSRRAEAFRLKEMTRPMVIASKKLETDPKQRVINKIGIEKYNKMLEKGFKLSEICEIVL